MGFKQNTLTTERVLEDTTMQQSTIMDLCLRPNCASLEDAVVRNHGIKEDRRRRENKVIKKQGDARPKICRRAENMSQILITMRRYIV